ncbi:hypothetical protein EXE49_02580 [Halorubrum sp. ASP121]|nr:hypothetical protein EXE49_02580 [Halorubrum sp. ASP121]
MPNSTRSNGSSVAGAGSSPPSSPRNDSAVVSWTVARKFRPVSSSSRSRTSVAALGLHDYLPDDAVVDYHAVEPSAGPPTPAPTSRTRSVRSSRPFSVRSSRTYPTVA